MEWPTRGRHSIFLQTIVNYCRKRFIPLGPDVLVSERSALAIAKIIAEFGVLTRLYQRVVLVKKPSSGPNVKKPFMAENYNFY